MSDLDCASRVKNFLASLIRATPAMDVDVRAVKKDDLSCLLVQVRDDTGEEIRRNVERVMPIFLNQRGVIMDMMASIQLVAFGAFAQGSERSRETCAATSVELLDALRANVRVVSFHGDIAYGNVGSGDRMSYTVQVPKFDRLLAALLSTPFGSAMDFGLVE